MKSENLIQRTTYAFALRIVKLSRFLVEKKREYVLSKQILESGTSIGANVEEAQAGQSRKDFISKYAIALKEARETRYWLRLLMGSSDRPTEAIVTLCQETEEIMRILAAIIVKTKQNTPGKT